MKYIGMIVFLFIFLTAADHYKNTTMDYNKELLKISEDLKEADRLNKKLEKATATDKQIKLIKKKIKKEESLLMFYIKK